MFSTWINLSQNCAVFKLNYKDLMWPPETSDDNDGGGWGIRRFFPQCTSFLPTLSCHSPFYQEKKLSLRIFLRFENYLKTVFWGGGGRGIDTEFLFENDSAANSIFSLFRFIWVQTSGPPGTRHLGWASFILRWGCPTGCTMWRKSTECPVTKSDKAANRIGCKDWTRWETTRWDAEVSMRRKTSLKKCCTKGTAWKHILRNGSIALPDPRRPLLGMPASFPCGQKGTSAGLRLVGKFTPYFLDSVFLLSIILMLICPSLLHMTTPSSFLFLPQNEFLRKAGFAP